MAKTERKADHGDEALYALRHSTAHVMAGAVLDLFPGAKFGFGPPVQDGFYYDFDLPRPLTPDDLAMIEEKMREVVKRDTTFLHREMSVPEALKFFGDRKQDYKVEQIQKLGGADTEDEAGAGDAGRVSTYQHNGFVDLCKGPHVERTGKIGPFKLLSIAGAYWKGNEHNKQLQRIYGTAFFTTAELDEHLRLLEEARKRDHRKLGRELDLFMFHPFAPGAAFWTERGTTVYNVLNAYMREIQRDDYREIKTPLMYNRKLWELSGHWGKYRDNMFLVLDNESGEHEYSLKPMNCPSHYVYYASKTHSYRELPIRFTTYDVLHRNEKSGTLSGLTRVRQFQQDDCHVFLREDQIESEVKRLTSFILAYYESFGLKASLKFATRPNSRIGDDAMWDRAEGALQAALTATGLPYEINPGDGAFYGPKIDFDVADSLGRKWQLGTIQLDYAASERFGLEYVGEDNAPHRPVVIHRAVNGSFERFIAILIEHYAGAFPLWLAPVQAIVLPISDRHQEYAARVRDRIAAAGLRVELDDRQEKIGYKIREAQLQKVPYMLVTGDREAAEGTVSVRSRSAGDLGARSIDAFVAAASDEIATKSPGMAAPAEQKTA